MSVKAERRAADMAPQPGRDRPSALRASSVLLASHDTEGSRAAERAALDAVVPGGRLHHLVIVPEFWRSITGDGWRINASTEHAFCDYLEAQIEREILEHLNRVNAQARARGIHYSASSEHGRLADCVVAASEKADYDLVMIGAPRPKGEPGLRSRLDLDRLTRALRIPLVVVPHPGASRKRSR
ncbi:MAG: hypothetical protein F9K29_06310 [Hyphomicrobiaceae bacterium]|nr:MAG: hypothetical protein F9K29_06310 [Hyphomicrobiaceae bacterium]